MLEDHLAQAPGHGRIADWAPGQRFQLVGELVKLGLSYRRTKGSPRQTARLRLNIRAARGTATSHSRAMLA
jgi:hypothetical protein